MKQRQAIQLTLISKSEQSGLECEHFSLRLRTLEFLSAHLSEGFDGDYVVRSWISLH